MLRASQLRNPRVKTENIRRLCDWLGIDPSTNGERNALIAWLAWEGHVYNDLIRPPWSSYY